jgi:cytochrome c oxidase assembly protein subunit 15
MLWTGLTLVDPERAQVSRSQRTARIWAIAFIALICLMIVTGGFVAGSRAGFAYNTFPLMQGSIVPPEIFMIEPVWRNFFWNMATVQFDHRLIAWVIAFVAPLLWSRVSGIDGLPLRARIGGHLLLALVALQIALGIATLVFTVPIPLAAAHQAGAVLVFAAALNVAHTLR